MTENQSVPSPPGLPQLSNATTTPSPEEVGDSNGEIRCICEYNDDDGYTICCDKCDTWQHLVCMQLEEDKVPSAYMCTNCLPRVVDAARARELQKKRRKQEQQDRGSKPNNNHSKDTKRKRSSTASHKKKEPQTNGPNGAAPSKTSQSTEKNGVTRVPSPRESQAPTTARKRAQRASQTHPRGNSPPEVSGATNFVALCATDRNGDTEDDNDFEKYKYEFIDISGSQDKYSCDDVKSFVQAVAPNDSHKIMENEDRFRRYTHENFSADMLPKAAVKPLPDLSKPYFEYSRWCYVIESSCSKGQPVALFKGEIGFQESYKREPINQYSIWNHPKPYVLFHPDLPLYIDARNNGSEARFVRRSCRPNLTMGTIIVDSDVYFGFYATESLKPGTELTVGWDWNSSKYSRQLIEDNFDLAKLDSETFKHLGPWVHNLIDKMGDCACTGGDKCLLHKIRKESKIDYLPAKMSTTNGNGRKARTKRQQSSEPNGLKEYTPDSNDNHSRAGSVANKNKSRSRDLTPSFDTAVEPGTMTGREARKFKDVLSRIEKQEQEGHHPPVPKKRKRNSVVNNALAFSSTTTSPSSDIPKGLDGKKRQKSVSVANNAEISMVDAGTSRRTSNSSNSSNGHNKKDRGSKSYVESSSSSVSSKVRYKVISRIPKPIYVSTAMQTEETDNELPWWQLPVENTSPRPPRITLRKSLLLSMQRDREEAANAATTAQDKKRKFEEIAEDIKDPSSPPKVAKLPDTQARRSMSPLKTENPIPELSVSCAMQVDGSKLSTMDSNIAKFAATPRSPGPTLGELFADSDRSRDSVQEPKKEPEAPVKPTVPQVNGTRPGLHLQLPTSISLTSAPNTATSQSTATPSTGTATSPLAMAPPNAFSPSVMSAVSASSAFSPTTKTKKISLKDYKERKNKAPDPVADKKAEEGPPMVSLVNNSKPIVLLKEQSKIADILTPTEGTLPTPQPSLDPKIAVPQRIANVR